MIINITRISQRFDLLVLASALLFGIIVTGMSVMMGIGRWGMGIGSILASGVYLIWRSQGFIFLDGGGLPQLTVQHYKLATIFFCIILSIAVIFNGLYYQYRPPLFFVLIALAWTSILVDILAVRQSRWLTGLTLLKICTISVVFRATRYYELATIPGNDTQFHLDLAMIIYESGKLPTESAVTSHPQYIFTSLWHTAMASIKHVLGVSIPDIPFLAATIPFVLITVWAAYALSEHIGGTVSHGLAASFLISFSDIMILRGASAIYTSSYVIPLTAIALVVLYRYHDRRGKLLAGLLIAAILLIHQLSSFVSIVLICSIVLAANVHRRFFGGNTPMTQIASTSLLLGIGISMIGWWMQIPHGSGLSFFESMSSRLIGTLATLGASSGGGGYSESLAQYSAVSNILYTFGSDILFTLAVLGILLVSHRLNQSPNQLYLFVPTFVVFTMIYPATIIGLDDLLLPHRLLAFLQLCFVILGAIGVIHALQRSSNPAVALGITVFIFIFVFAMITTPYINRNSPVYLEDREPRVDLYDSEAEAVVWTMEYENGEPIYHDSHLSGRQAMTLATINGYDYDQIEFSEYPEDPSSTGIYLIRQYFSEQDEVAPRGTFGNRGEVVNGNDLVQPYRSDYLVYNNGKSMAYTQDGFSDKQSNSRPSASLHT